MGNNVRVFNKIQGVVLGTLAGVAGWAILVGTAMWAVS